MAPSLEIVRGDITAQAVDAIVNAANETLLGGGGVDGAIHRAGGPAILAECRALGGCEPGDAKVTGAGDLPARFVVHAVGPRWQGGGAGEDALLARCHRRAIALAGERGCDSIAFPAIATGAFGFPVERAARVGLEAALSAPGCDGLGLVRFVLFSDEHLGVFEQARVAMHGA